MLSFFGGAHADLPTLIAEFSKSRPPHMGSSFAASSHLSLRPVVAGRHSVSLTLYTFLSSKTSWVTTHAFGCLFVSSEWWLQIGRRWWRTYIRTHTLTRTHVYVFPFTHVRVSIAGTHLVRTPTLMCRYYYSLWYDSRSVIFLIVAYWRSKRAS